MAQVDYNAMVQGHNDSLDVALAKINSLPSAGEPGEDLTAELAEQASLIAANQTAADNNAALIAQIMTALEGKVVGENVDLEDVIEAVLEQAKASGAFDGSAGTDGGYYTPSVVQTSDDSATFSFEPSKAEMPAVPDATITLPSGGGTDDQYVVLADLTFDTAKANTDEWGGETHIYGHRHIWTTDVAGNPVDADGIYVRVYVPKQTDPDTAVTCGQLNCFVGQGDFKWWGSWSSDEAQPYFGYSSFVYASNVSKVAMANFDYDLRAKTAKSSAVSTNYGLQEINGNYASIKQVDATSFPYVCAKNRWEYWRGVQIDLVSGSLPAGTKIFIYARKRNAAKVSAIPNWEVT